SYSHHDVSILVVYVYKFFSSSDKNLVRSKYNILEAFYPATPDGRFEALNNKGEYIFIRNSVPGLSSVLMNRLMILVKIIKLRWIHILSYDQMGSRKINNQTTRCANSIFYTPLFTNSAPNYT